MATCAAELIATLLHEQSTRDSHLGRLSRDLIQFVIGPYIAEPGTFSLVSQSSRGLRGLLVSSYDLSNDSMFWIRERGERWTATLVGTTLVGVLFNGYTIRLGTLPLCDGEPAWTQLKPQFWPSTTGRKVTEFRAMPVRSQSGSPTNTVAVQLYGVAGSTGGVDWMRCDFDITKGNLIRSWNFHTMSVPTEIDTIRTLDDGSQYSWRFKSNRFNQWHAFFKGVDLVLETPSGGAAPTVRHIPASEFSPHPALWTNFDPNRPDDLMLTLPGAFCTAYLSLDMRRLVVFLATETSLVHHTSIVMVHIFDLETLCRIGEPLVITNEPRQPEHPKITEDRVGNFLVTTVNTFYIVSSACNTPTLTSLRYRARFSPCYPILPVHLPDDSVAAVGVYIGESREIGAARRILCKVGVQLKVGGYHSKAPLPQARNVSQRDTPLWICLTILFGMLCRLLTLAWHRIRPYLRW